MSLPNMSRTVKNFSIPVKLFKVTTTIVQHKPVENYVESSIKCVVQPAQKEKLNKDKIDWSLRYIQVHSIDQILIDDEIEYKGIRYKAFEDGDYSEYGYYENIMEEQK